MIEVFVVAMVRRERNDDLKGYERVVRVDIKKQKYRVTEDCLKLWHTDDCEELRRTRFEHGGLVMEARSMLRDEEFVVPYDMENEIVSIFRILEK